METISGQEIGEYGAHLLEAEGDLAAFLLTCVSDDGEMCRVNFEPGRFGSGTERGTEDRGEEAYAKRDRQESRHGRRAEGSKEMLPRASCERSPEVRMQVKEKAPRCGAGYSQCQKYKARLPSKFRLRRHGVRVNGPKVPFARTSWTVARRMGESNPSGCFQPSNASQACLVPTLGVSSETSPAKSEF